MISVDNMRALILFYSKSGVRIAVQSYAPLFSALIAWIMLSMYPAATVRNIAAGLFAPRPALPGVFALAALAFLLPAWAALRLAAGVNGWMRHLPLSGAAHRGGLTLALGIVQAPLAAALALLAVVASGQQLAVAGPLTRHLLVLIAGAVGALRVARRFVVLSLAPAAAATAAFGAWWAVPLSVPLLVAAGCLAGSIRERRRLRPLPTAGTFFELRTAWRAVRWRILRAYGAGLAVVGATALFASNNPMPGPLLSATVRFGGSFAVALFMTVLAQQLAVRRPVWPWARSLPYSSGRRILSDALILGLPAVPLLALASFDRRRGRAGLPVRHALALVACGWVHPAHTRAKDRGRHDPGRRICPGGGAGAVRMVVAGLVGRGACGVRRGPAARDEAEGDPLARIAPHRRRRSHVLEWLMIRFTGVSFDYGSGNTVLKDVTVDIGQGLTLLLGPNGAGKSTLLKLAAGVERPDSGKVEIDGLDLWREEAAARRTLAYVSEQPDLTPYATIRDVLQLVCRLRSVAPASAGEVLEKCGLGSFSGRSIRELSMGQRRRAVLAAAWIGEPRTVLLDEPLEAMDRGMRDDIISWIDRLLAREALVLVATHDIEPFVARARRALTVAGRRRLFEPLPGAAAERLACLEALSRGQVLPALALEERV